MKRLSRTGLIAFAALLATLSQFGVAHAVTASNPGSADTLKLSPLRSDVTIAPGASTKVTITVSNLTNSAQLLKPIENDFIAGPGENGTPSIILDQSKYAPTHSLKRYMVPLNDAISVPANGSASVDVTIGIPAGTQAGGYFGAVRFVAANTDSSQSLNLSTSVASLILVTVPGPTVEQLNMTDFDIQQAGTTGTSFRTGNGISLLMRFENKGNLQESPFGQIYVQKKQKTLYTYSFNQNSPKQTILPDSARRWSVPLSGFGKFGKYTIGATLTYGGNTSQTIDVSKTVWIIPSSLIFAAIGGVLGIIAIIVIFILFLKAYKRKILRQSRRRW